MTPDLKPRTPAAGPAPKPSNLNASPSFRPDSILPFQMGLPALDEFPRKIWARLGARGSRHASASKPALRVEKPGPRRPRALFRHVQQGLFPSLRLAHLVVPQAQIERFEQISQIFTGGSPELTQAVVTAFIKEGHFARHIQRMRRLCAERRDATATGLENTLGKYVRIDTQPGGMHLILKLQGRRSDRQLAARMRQAGLYAEPLTDWTADRTGPSALLVNFTNVDTQATAESLGKRILALIHGLT